MARGIYQAIFTFTNHLGDFGEFMSGNRTKEHWLVILDALKQSHSSILDIILMVLCGLIIIHGVIGVFYAILTDYNIKSMLRDKAWFYLQIISAFGAVFVVIALMIPSSNATSHTAAFWLIITLVAVLGSFHIANGFVNACITLGISVSNHIKMAVGVLSWIIAVISMLQIFIIFI